MTRNDRRIKRNVSSIFKFYRLARHLDRISFFVSLLQGLSTARSQRNTSMRTVFVGSASPRKREAPRGTVCFPTICRTVNSERVACMARALLQDGNGSWPNAEGGRRTSTESRESKLNSSTVVRGRAIPEKGYLTGGWWPPGESTDLPRTAPCGSWHTIAAASYGISEIPIAELRGYALCKKPITSCVSKRLLCVNC